MKQSALGARFLRDWETIVAKRKRRPRIAENPASWLAGYDDGIVARLQDPARPLRGSDVEAIHFPICSAMVRVRRNGQTR
jgi:hypothetical protein